MKTNNTQNTIQQTTHIITNGTIVVVRLLELQLQEQSVPITTKVVSSNPVHGEVYTIQHYMIKFMSDLRQVGGFLRVLSLVSSTNKTDRHGITEIVLKVVLNTKTNNQPNRPVASSQ